MTADRHVVTVHKVETLDGRRIPLRYTEIERRDGHVWACVEIWPNYPDGYDQVVFRHRLDPE
jgi:hypothetical protein